MHETQESSPQFSYTLRNDHGFGVNVVEVVAQRLKAFLELTIFPFYNEEAEDVANGLKVSEIVALLKLRRD